MSAPPNAPVFGTHNDLSSDAVEELILSGATFGKPPMLIFLYDHDHQLALQALAMSAAQSDIHTCRICGVRFSIHFLV